MLAGATLSTTSVTRRTRIYSFSFEIKSRVQLFQITQLFQVLPYCLFHKIWYTFKPMLTALNGLIDLYSESHRQVDSVIIVFPLAHGKNSYNDLF